MLLGADAPAGEEEAAPHHAVLAGGAVVGRGVAGGVAGGGVGDDQARVVTVVHVGLVVLLQKVNMS